MNWKQFLKPDRKKAIVFVILISLSSLISGELIAKSISQCKVTTYYGFPFSWVQQDCVTGTGVLCSGNKASCSASYKADQLTLGLIFWYLVSCLLVYLRKLLMPDWRRVVTFSAIFGLPLIITIFFVSQKWFSINIGILPKGFPLEFFSTVCREGALVNDCYLDFFNYSFLVSNIIFLYVISCLLIWIYDKLRKK
jgi:hypothetical protein